jgi:hypothetical protein
VTEIGACPSLSSVNFVAHLAAHRIESESLSTKVRDEGHEKLADQALPHD